jgi:hypothetical protein
MGQLEVAAGFGLLIVLLLSATGCAAEQAGNRPGKG